MRRRLIQPPCVLWLLTQCLHWFYWLPKWYMCKMLANFISVEIFLEDGAIPLVVGSFLCFYLDSVFPDKLSPSFSLSWRAWTAYFFLPVGLGSCFQLELNFFWHNFSCLHIIAVVSYLWAVKLLNVVPWSLASGNLVQMGLMNTSLVNVMPRIAWLVDL